MRAYQSKCLGTVDNIDTSPGGGDPGISLASGKKGFYGIKDTAWGLNPRIQTKLLIPEEGCSGGKFWKIK